MSLPRGTPVRRRLDGTWEPCDESEATGHVATWSTCSWSRCKRLTPNEGLCDVCREAGTMSIHDGDAPEPGGGIVAGDLSALDGITHEPGDWA